MRTARQVRLYRQRAPGQRVPAARAKAQANIAQRLAANLERRRCELELKRPVASRVAAGKSIGERTARQRDGLFRIWSLLRDQAIKIEPGRIELQARKSARLVIMGGARQTSAPLLLAKSQLQSIQAGAPGFNLRQSRSAPWQRHAASAHPPRQHGGAFKLQARVEAHGLRPKRTVELDVRGKRRTVHGRLEAESPIFLHAAPKAKRQRLPACAQRARALEGALQRRSFRIHRDVAEQQPFASRPRDLDLPAMHFDALKRQFLRRIGGRPWQRKPAVLAQGERHAGLVKTGFNETHGAPQQRRRRHFKPQPLRKHLRIAGRESANRHLTQIQNRRWQQLDVDSAGDFDARAQSLGQDGFDPAAPRRPVHDVRDRQRRAQRDDDENRQKCQRFAKKCQRRNGSMRSNDLGPAYRFFQPVCAVHLQEHDLNGSGEELCPNLIST